MYLLLKASFDFGLVEISGQIVEKNNVFWIVGI